jgi:hypothetical protein
MLWQMKPSSEIEMSLLFAHGLKLHETSRAQLSILRDVRPIVKSTCDMSTYKDWKQILVLLAGAMSQIASRQDPQISSFAQCLELCIDQTSSNIPLPALVSF